MMNSQAHPERFVPPSAKDFSKRAKNLSWLIQRPLQESQELLARIYGYADAHELRALVSGEAPASSEQTESASDGEQDDRPLRYFSSLAHQAGERALKVLAGGDTQAHFRNLTRREWKVRDIGLVHDMEFHKRDFHRVVAEILVDERLETPELLGVCATDYGKACPTQVDPGEFTIGMTKRGQAVRDVLRHIIDHYGEESARRDQRVYVSRIESLIERHPFCPWPIAQMALHYFYLGNDERGLALGIRAINLYREIISVKERASYCGANLVSPGFGFGTEPWYMPTLCCVVGEKVAAYGRLAEAIEYLEEGLMMDIRDGVGARSHLFQAYSESTKRPKKSLWREDLFGHALKAATLFDCNEMKRGVASFADALVYGRWIKQESGDEQSYPTTLKTLLGATEPVWLRRPDAYAFYSDVAENPRAKTFIKEAMSDLGMMVQMGTDSEYVARGLWLAYQGKDIPRELEDERDNKAAMITFANSQLRHF